MNGQPHTQLTPNPRSLRSAENFEDDPERKAQRWITLNKPDVTNNFIGSQELPETGIQWFQLTFAFEVTSDVAMDCKLSLVGHAQEAQVNQIKRFPATGEILTLTVCGPILRVWYMNPQRYGSTRGFSLENPDDYLDIVKIVALFSGPVSNYLPHWKPVAGHRGRMAMKTTDGESFWMELKDVELIDTRYDPYGRRTAVWSAGLANVSAIGGGENSKIPEIHLTKDEHLVIKTSWNLPHLRNHEQHVYQHIAKVEKELFVESGFERDPEVAIPELVGTLYCGENDPSSPLACTGDKPLANWSTRSVPVDTFRNDPQGEEEQMFFTVLVTKCRRVKPIKHWRLDVKQQTEIYRKLFKNLKHLAMLGVHYRDLNMGNILCDPKSMTCLLADLDFARIENRRRGEAERESELWQTSLEDCVSGNLLFMSRHVQASRQRNIELAEKELEKSDTQAAYSRAMSNSASEVEHRKAQEQYDLTKIAQENVISKLRIITIFWTIANPPSTPGYGWQRASRKAERKGFSCGPLGPIGSLYDPSVKETLFLNPMPACSKISKGTAWATMITAITRTIRDAQKHCRTLEPSKRLSNSAKIVFEECDRLMREFVDPNASITPELST